MPVLLVPLPGLLGGLALLVFYRPFLFAAPFAAILFVITAIFRPRLNRLPRNARAVTRQQAPQLYDVLDRLAAQTGTPKLESVVVTTGTRIAIGRIGWRYRRVLLLGLPAWVALNPQERYAVLAHATYDDQRGTHDRVLGAAEHILGELAAAVQPGALDSAGDGKLKSSEGVVVLVGQGSDDQVLHSRLVQIANAVLGPPIRGYRRLLRRLDLSGRQRREYRIDRRVAELVGSEPTARSLERLLLAGACFRALARAVRFEPGCDPLDVLRRTAAEIPDHELVRLIRVDQAQNGRTDADHPPTWQRTRLLRANPTPTTSVFAPSKDDELAAAARAAVRDYD
ncbi:M48 family metallopeptidase [Kribbella sp. NPDC000426]|uniref:M48 family metallopeptidase n=1 Tax=Kribbella sp. NPDC000426 TaxID=3154255 RepID=UPI00331876B5